MRCEVSSVPSVSVMNDFAELDLKVTGQVQPVILSQNIGNAAFA